MGFRLQDHTTTEAPVQATRHSLTFDDTLKGWQEELDSYYAQMQEFPKMQPDEIFRSLSGFTARMNFIRTKIVRTENKRYSSFRTKEIEPFITECQFQFKVYSRMHSVTSLEWEMVK